MARNPFTERFGKPSPSLASDIQFRTRSLQRLWENDLRAMGAGWFMNRFLLLFGGELQPLKACCDAWSFVVPPGRERIILGRNAYGALLVLEDPEGAQQVYVLDPLRVTYWTDPNLVLGLLTGRWLAKRQLPDFLDDALYRMFVRDDEYLPDDHILAVKVPISLGGKMEPQNFQEEEIVSYYQSTAPVYAKAFAKMAKGAAPPKPPRKPAKKGRR